MKSIGKYLLIILIAFAVGFIASNKYYDDSLISQTVVTKRDTIVKVIVDSVPFKVIDTVRVKGETVVINVPSSNPMGGEPVFKEVETTKYTGKEELSNGTIDYEIYADSLYATSFKLTTKETTINNTTTITNTVPTKSRLFLMGGTDLNWENQQPQAAEIGLMYNRRQKWGVGLGVRHDLSGLLPANNRTTIGVKVYIGL